MKPAAKMGRNCGPDCKHGLGKPVVGQNLWTGSGPSPNLCLKILRSVLEDCFGPWFRAEMSITLVDLES